jgi:integrase
MAKFPDYPGVSSFEDRHGVTRYKFRKTGLQPRTIRGEPHTPEFDADYQAAITGTAVAAPARLDKPVRQVSTGPVVGSLDDIWAKLQTRPKWLKLSETTRYQYSYLLQAFLDARNEHGVRRGTAPIAELEPHQIQDALDRLSASNSTILKLMIRKLYMEAAMQPSLGLKYDPTTLATPVEKAHGAGRKPWPAALCAKFEAAWNIGTTPRTVYEIVRWLGLRVGDIVRLRWDMLIEQDGVWGFEFVQHKGRNKEGAFSKFHPMTPMLEAALAHLDRSAEYVVLNRHGKPFSDGKILSQRFWEDWGPWAEIPAGYSLHGIRKVVGAMLSDAGATLHESRDFLGHATYKEVANYNKARDQRKSAIGAAKKVTEMVRR